MSSVSSKKPRKKLSAGKKSGLAEKSAPERTLVLHLVAAAASGAVLGLSAPGLNQWYLAWCGLVPLLLLVCGSPTIGGAFVRGTVFGLAYNLVYANWLLGLHPLTWLGFAEWESMLMAIAAWVGASLHQAVIVGIFATLCRLIPMTGSFLPRKIEDKWCLPSLLIVPLFWVLIENKIGNASDFLGVPWTMIEYSQYKQLAMIHICRLVGGIGLGFLMVMANVALSGLLATASAKFNWKSLAAPTMSAAAFQAALVALLITGSYAWGLSDLVSNKDHAPVSVSILQSSINIDMQKTEHRYTLNELLERYLKMAARNGADIFVFPENALPANLKAEPRTQQALFELARNKKSDLLIGAIDYDESKQPFNSAYGIKSDGTMLPVAYHKRYLVPFGEYTPSLVKYCPEWLLRLTNTPAGSGFAAGKQPAILYLSRAKVAPVICFESLSPELVCDSVRHGGELLVNLSDLAWFHDSMVGDQMLAFSVLRAVENKRYFVFAANSGPSAIIDPNGKLIVRSSTGTQQVVKGNIGISSEITPFTDWFR